MAIISIENENNYIQINSFLLMNTKTNKLGLIFNIVIIIALFSLKSFSYIQSLSQIIISILLFMFIFLSQIFIIFHYTAHKNSDDIKSLYNYAVSSNTSMAALNSYFFISLNFPFFLLSIIIASICFNLLFYINFLRTSFITMYTNIDKNYIDINIKINVLFNFRYPMVKLEFNSDNIELKIIQHDNSNFFDKLILRGELDAGKNNTNLFHVYLMKRDLDKKLASEKQYFIGSTKDILILIGLISNLEEISIIQHKMKIYKGPFEVLDNEYP